MKKNPAYDHEAVLPALQAGKNKILRAAAKKTAQGRLDRRTFWLPWKQSDGNKDAQTAEKQNTASCPSGHSSGHTRAESRLPVACADKTGAGENRIF
ncbi:MAG: hypothetical protein ACLSFO_03195 [Anaerovoracaceae bacterium]